MTSPRAIERLHAAFRELEAALVDLVEGDGWVDQATSPLGRRAHNEACRSGQISARKLRGRWLAKRSDVDAFIQRAGRLPVAALASRDEAEEMREIATFKARRRTA